MAAVGNNKIVLKNTTKMSLNERFTGYRTQVQAASTYRQKIQLQRQASSANLRLAQQMSNRPSVIAALRLKKKSMQNRLGLKQQSTNGNIKSRLNLAISSSNRPIQGRLGAFRGRGMARRGSFKAGTSPLLKSLKGRLGVPKSRFTNQQNNPQRSGFNRRGGFQGNRLTRGGMQKQISRSNPRVTRGRGRGRGWWNKAKASGSIPTKQELDNQLDEYMAETKSTLDAQLGQYMSQG